MTATQHRKDADIRHALDLLIEARATFRLHGDTATEQVIDLAYNLGSSINDVVEFPPSEPIPFTVVD